MTYIEIMKLISDQHMEILQTKQILSSATFRSSYELMSPMIRDEIADALSKKELKVFLNIWHFYTHPGMEMSIRELHRLASGKIKYYTRYSKLELIKILAKKGLLV